MNKTVNINLAGSFFYIDEDAYNKLQHYLDAIKKSFNNTDGSDEIIADIETRIAELFNERTLNKKQVVGIKEVDEVISIMGQPEDYLVDEAIFDDAPNVNTKTKKLFRDTSTSYIGGVSAGLGHYFGVKALWIRLIWIILFFSAGTGILLYILLWIFIPEAKSTTDKLLMHGQPINISNIEKKIKDGFGRVSDTVSDVANKVDVKKHSEKLKSSSRSFFDAVADVVLFLLTLVAKFIGVLFLIIGAITIIALLTMLFSLIVSNFLQIPGLEFASIFNAGNTPLWFAALLVFFTIAIPFFFLFYLGLKILISNLKSIGRFAKFSLLGIWLLSIMCLTFIGIREVSEHANTESVAEAYELPIKKRDTLNVLMAENKLIKNLNRNGYKLRDSENGKQTLYMNDINLHVKSTQAASPSINIEKYAEGGNYEKAIDRAKEIQYSYTFNNNELDLQPLFSTPASNKYSGQRIIITLNIPEGTIVRIDKNTNPFLIYDSNEINLFNREQTIAYLKVENDKLVCINCETETEIESDTESDSDAVIEVDTEGIKIKKQTSGKAKNVKIDKNGIEVNY